METMCQPLSLHLWICQSQSGRHSLTPLKEGICGDLDFYSFDEGTLKLLLEVATTIYRAAVAVDERKEVCFE